LEWVGRLYKNVEGDAQVLVDLAAWCRREKLRAAGETTWGVGTTPKTASKAAVFCPPSHG
jgi:hypothetical protein